MEPPAISPDTSSWLGSLLAAMFTMLVYYTGGWLIGAGFYRYDAALGLLDLAFALVLLFFVTVPVELLHSGKLVNVPPYVYLLVTACLTAAAFWRIKQVTRRVRIKVK